MGAYQAQRTASHSNSHPTNVAAQNIVPGQMPHHCSRHLGLNMCVFCCSLSHWMGFLRIFSSLASVSVTFFQTDVSVPLGNCSGHVWKHSAVGGVGEWVLEVFEPGPFAWILLQRKVYSAWCLLRGVWTVWSVSLSSCLEKANPQQTAAAEQCGLLLYPLLAMKSELTAGSCGTASALMIS